MLKTLGIVAALALTGLTAHAETQPAQAPEAQQAAAVATVGEAEDWSPAVRAYWQRQASDYRWINGAIWSVRGDLARARLANTPSVSAAIREAWQRDDAPAFVRLSDGKQVAIVWHLLLGIPGVEVLRGRVVAVDGDVLEFKEALYRRYGRSIFVHGLSRDALGDYSGQVYHAKKSRNDNLYRETNAHGHYQPFSFVAIKKDHKHTLESKDPFTKDTADRRLAVNLVMQSVTPEQLRAACRVAGLQSLPDFWPVLAPGTDEVRWADRQITIPTDAR